MASATGIPNIPVNPNLFLQISKNSLTSLNLTPGDILLLDIVKTLPDNQYLMHLKGVAITVKSEMPLNSGDQLQVKVQSVHPQLVLQTVDVQQQKTDIKADENYAQKGLRPGALLKVLTGGPELSGSIRGADRALPILSEGQTLPVTVQEKMPGNQYVLALKGTTATVSSETPLVPGDKLNIMVRSVQPQLVLQVLEPQEQAVGMRTYENGISKGVNSAQPNQVVTKAVSPFESIKASGQKLPDLSPGQTVAVTVQEKLAEGRYQVVLRDVSIMATSEVPLKEGDRLQVKVQSVQPQIILNVIDAPKQAVEAKINEKLVQWRINPESLTQLFDKVDEFSENLKSVSLPSGFSAKDSDVLLKIFNSIVLSPKTKTNPLFVKDFITRIGLLLEKDLAAMVSQKSAEGSAQPSETLKSLLLKLSESINRTMQDAAKINVEEIGKFKNIASFTADALKAVETGQAVNVVYQKNEDGLYLQIPLVLGEAYRQAEIFIRPDDKNAPVSQKYSSCSVNIFLNLDYLGEIAIDARLQEGRIRCIIKCENEETRELLNASSKDLQDALTSIGYGVGRIECVKTQDIAGQKAEFIAQQILGTVDLVNSYA